MGRKKKNLSIGQPASPIDKKTHKNKKTNKIHWNNFGIPLNKWITTVSFQSSDNQPTITNQSFNQFRLWIKWIFQTIFFVFSRRRRRRCIKWLKFFLFDEPWTVPWFYVIFCEFYNIFFRFFEINERMHKFRSTKYLKSGTWWTEGKTSGHFFFLVRVTKQWKIEQSGILTI